ncbi:MAG: HD-GYP domain-containing protein [Treponema sp.]|nr:HD-GYP domain-containing protein [Treponema sp.]
MTNITDDNIKIQQAEKFYISFLKYTQSVFTSITDIGALDIDSVAEKIRILWNEVRYNRRFLLYTRPCVEPLINENYLASHSVRSAVIAMIIGVHLKLPNHRLVELGIATLLHDIGMLRLPPETYLKNLDLTESEKRKIYTHPVHGYKMLMKLKFPLSIRLGVLDHHERENGSGYPRKLKEGNISLYGRIIAVACSYEALSAKRQYKKAKDDNTGIMELLQNENKQYNDTVVKALATALSFYPIGTFVLLSDGNQGQVFDVNPLSHLHHAVRLLEPENKEEKTIVWTSDKGVSIVRPLTREEIDHEKAQ